jgi:hypothetical protein
MKTPSTLPRTVARYAITISSILGSPGLKPPYGTRRLNVTAARRVVLALTVSLLAVSAARAAANGPQAAFSESILKVTGITPNAEVAVMGVIRTPLPGAYMTRVTSFRRVVSAGTDGGVAVDAGFGPTSQSVWAVVDLTSKKVALVASGTPLQQVDVGGKRFHKHGTLVDAFSSGSAHLHALYVTEAGEPFSWMTLDGGRADTDGVNGFVTIDVAQGRTLRPDPPPQARVPSRFAPGAVLIAVDPLTLQIAVIAIDGGTLGDAQ